MEKGPPDRYKDDRIQYIWRQIKVKAQDRRLWKTVVNGLCPRRDDRKKKKIDEPCHRVGVEHKPTHRQYLNVYCERQHMYICTCVLLDSRLDISAQVSNVCRAAYSNLFRIAKIRTSLTTAACKTLVHALVTSWLDYGNAVLYGISDRLLHRLEMVQRSAARVVLRLRRGDRRSMTAALKQLHWLPCPYVIASSTRYSLLCFGPYVIGRRRTSPHSSRRMCRVAPCDLQTARC